MPKVQAMPLYFRQARENIGHGKGVQREGAKHTVLRCQLKTNFHMKNLILPWFIAACLKMSGLQDNSALLSRFWIAPRWGGRWGGSASLAATHLQA